MILASNWSRPWLRDCAWLILLSVPPALLTAWLHPRHFTWQWDRSAAIIEVTPDEVARWSGRTLWVDARSEVAYLRGHIPGAILCNEDAWHRLLPGFFETWQPHMKVVVYCSVTDCDASQAVAQRLRRELNLSDIYVLRGGWTAWQQTQP